MSGLAVFLDRDGVINEEVDLLYRRDQLKLLPCAAEAIRRLNQANMKTIVVTNQPVVARGLCTESDVDAIHDALRQKLYDSGAHLDAIYYCPHHPNADMPDYRKDCPDRKPDPGMLLRAARDFELNLSDCVMVGDRTVDIQTGRNAGCRTVLVRTGYGGKDGKHDVSPDAVRDTLAGAVDWIIAELGRE